MKVLFAALMVAFFSNSALSAPDINPSPQDRIEVVGTIPGYVDAVVQEDWYTTNDSIFCEKLSGEAGFSPLRFSKTARMTSTSGGHRTWLVSRDEVLPGHCEWALKQIVVYLDSKASGLPPVRPSNIPTQIASVCLANEPCENSWFVNDDNTKPTYHYCKFSATARALGNPCAYFDEKFRGTDKGKQGQILLPNQHSIRFNIIDLEQTTP